MKNYDRYRDMTAQEYDKKNPYVLVLQRARQQKNFALAV